MIDALYVAATGMQGQQQNVDVIANNLANVNTPAYKRQRVVFEDVMRQSAVNATPSAEPAAATNIGAGTAVDSIAPVFTQGEANTTGAALDIAIQGEGFYEVVLPDGQFAYTRNGQFHLDASGSVVTAHGYPLSTDIQMPSDITGSLVVGKDGKVTTQAQGSVPATDVGQIVLARFTNPAGLKTLGEGLYAPTQESGDAVYAEPGQDGMATLGQGVLESSNVNLVDELTSLVIAQRGYQMSARVAQVADTMLATVNDLRR